MIPPIPPSVLTANPQFALLHQHLTTHLLNPDASTRSLSLLHEPTAKELRKHHVQAAKEDVLKRSLHNVVADKNLPPELGELVLNIAIYLSEAPNMNLSREAHDLMAPEVEAFRDHLNLVSPSLSKHISHERDSLLRLAGASCRPSTSTGTSITNTTSSSLPTKLTTTSLTPTLTAAVTTLATLHHTTLPTTLKRHTTTLSTLLALHAIHHHTLIQHLELHTHGTLSRHTAARATYLLTVASGLAAKIHLLALQAGVAIYSPAQPVQRALTNYAAHLHGCRQTLERRGEALRRELDLYEDGDGGGGGKALRECARRYRGVEREIEVVRGEIARLQQ